MYENDDPFTDLNPTTSQRLRRRDRARKPRKAKGHRKPAKNAPTVHGLVIEAAPGHATVVTAHDEVLDCVLPPDVRRRQRQDLCVGDLAVVAREDGDANVLVRVLPRRTVLVRQDTQRPDREQVLVANIDTVCVVGAASDPPFRPRLVDRYLVAVRRSGARPVVVVNKLDEADDARRNTLDAQLEPYRALAAVHVVSAQTGEGLAALLQELADQRCAFVGHSGVGKSSLVVALGASAEAGGLSGHGRGRHTTSTATLHRLGGGTEVIDTPGIRQFGLVHLTIHELKTAFEDFAPFAERCAYRTCSHRHEPDCAVRAAAEAGTLSAARYDSYIRLTVHADD